MIDSLEHRRLFAFAADINFQPASAAVPSGYLVDAGHAFGSRGGGMTYGWDVANSANAKDRNADNSPDQRYDTLNYLKRGTAHRWEIAVPNGSYDIRLVAGEPLQSGARAIIYVEGTTAIDVKYSSSVRWADQTVRVNVTDGRLTIAPDASSDDAKLCFIEIREITGSAPVEPPPPPSASSQTLQAETAILSGGTVKATKHGGYQGTGFADYAGLNAAVQWSFNWQTAGHARIDLRYANGSTADRPLAILVDGLYVGTIAFAPTGSWTTWGTASLNVELKTGVNTIKAIAITSAGGANVDALTITATTAVYDAELIGAIPGVFNTVQQSANRSLADLNSDASKYPNLTKPDGTWEIINHTQWTSGFWPGVLWEIYRFTGGSTWLDNAIKWTTPLGSQTQKEGDLAFRFMPTYLPLYEYSKNSAHRDVLLKAAAAKNAMWNETVGAFQTTWYFTHTDNAKANFAVLLDMTTDLELLMWAGRETGNQQYIDRAIRHFEKVITALMAPDGGTRHFGMFDKATGQFQGNETYQGYADNSTWGRGQGWAIYSFATMARDTGRADFLAAAQKVADYYLANMPADGVTYWDFNDPAIPAAYRDSSAAAVAADGMLQIAKRITDPAAAKYQQGAEKILKSLISNYLISDPVTSTQRGLLRHGALDVPHRPAASDVTLIFGDYYFLHALNRYRTFA